MNEQTTPAEDSTLDAVELVRVVAGRYRVDDRIGAGGMGVVWRGYDEKLRRRVALKEVIIPHGMAAADAANLRQRYLREARAAAALHHRNVIGVYDVLTEAEETATDPADTSADPGRVWIVMELVDAENLADLIRRNGRLDTRTVAAIGLQLVDALSAAHGVGVLHRDVKPANVIVVGADPESTATDALPRAVLTDFGVAAISGDPTLTRTGQLIGSPVYLPPERLVGAGKGGPKSDLWALGSTLYAALVGKPPFFRKDHLEVITAITAEPVPSSEYLGELAPVIAGLLEKDPERRWGVEQTRAALRAVLHSAPVGAVVHRGSARDFPITATLTEPPSGWIRQPADAKFSAKPQPIRRYVLAVGLVLLILGGVLGAAALLGWFDDDTDNSGTNATTAHTAVFDHPTLNYHLEYPAQWEAECEKPTVCRFAPAAERLKLFVIVESRRGAGTFDARTATQLESAGNIRNFAAYSEKENERRTIGPHTGWWLEYTFKDDVGPRQVQVFRISGDNGTVYAISLNGRPELVAQNTAALTDAIKSFELSHATPRKGQP